MGSRAPLVVTADDTTGALETAAACADAGWSAVVSTATADGATGPTAHPVDLHLFDLHLFDLHLFDLRSRHLPTDEAAARLRAIVERHPGLRAHKIDSTLRGGWPAEVSALAHAGRRVLMVPAFPAAGRTCVDGTVLVHGVPVHQTAFGRDPRSPVTDARPAARIAGASNVRDLAAARAALAAGARIVIADAQTDEDVAALAAHAAAHPDLVLVGPAAVVTALVRCLGPDRPPTAPVPVTGRLLVASASRHPVADEQLAELEAYGVEVLRPPADARIEDAELVLAELARATHERLDADVTIATVVVVGGDTTAAVIGDAAVEVEGTLGVGIAVGSVELRGRRLRLVTKPGGFGAAGTLVDVLQDAL